MSIDVCTYLGVLKKDAGEILDALLGSRYCRLVFSFV
jgi:hypothetical protein